MTSRPKTNPMKTPPGGRAAPRTLTDPSGTAPVLSDPVVRLRVWGSHDDYDLNAVKLDESGEIKIGSASTCRIRVDAPSVSKLHASLRRSGGRWILRDLASKNQTRLDGRPQAEVIIEPGSEIAIGRVTLIAESMRSIVLRTFLSRVIGWTDDRLHDIDFALRSIRITSARRAPLALYGNDDLVSIAYDIHRLAFGELKPFVLCDPERTTKDRIRRGVSVLKAAAEAIDAAAGGSICVWATRRPSEFPDLARRLALPSTVAQLVIVGRDAGSVESYGAKPIEIPLLHHRNAEIEQIVRGYGDDARERLVTSLRLHSKGREWVRKHCATALGEIQKGTERVLALKHFGNFAKAANWLGISPQGLTHWMESRDITSMDGLDAY